MSSRAWRLAAVAATAAIAVAVAVLVSSASSDTPTKARVQAAPADLFAGIPERDGVLGAVDAPVTLTEFVDLQCPVCAAASKQLLPSILDDYVRTGKVKLDARVLQFLGPDSVTAARYAAGARAQDKLWPFLETFYASQGQENSGYVTPDFLASVAKTAGVDAAAAGKVADSAAAETQLNAANQAAETLGVTGTPTFAVSEKGKPMRIVSADDLASVLG